MTTKKIAVFGASGQVGQALASLPLPPDWKIHGFSSRDCDMTNAAQLREVVQRVRPDLVINSAAMTAVDKCETEKEKATALNFEAAANLAAQCSATDAPLIHLSTDYVFDGGAAEPYTENDAMNPLNIYGHTKMMGEEAVRHTHPWHVILRISSVFSEFGQNILTRTLQNVKAGGEMKSVTDQIACPTYATDIAKAMVKIGTDILGGKIDGFGTFHFCGDEAVTRFRFTECVIDAARPHLQQLPTLLPAKTVDFPSAAARPAYSAMDCSKIVRVYDIRPSDWRAGVRHAVDALLRAETTQRSGAA